VRKSYFAALGQTALISLAALGCAGFPSFRGGTPITPLAAPKPGPMKQIASAVSQSSLGKSVSKVFKTSKKNPVPPTDPTALASGIAPTKASDYVAMGETFEQNGDAEAARRMFHKALELEPQNLAAFIGLGRHFDRQGQLDRASEYYVLATRHYPKDPVAFNDLGLCYARQQRYDDAVVMLSRAIELDPDRALYRNNIAMALVAQGRNDEALAHLTDAHGPAKAHYNLGYLLDKRGQRQAALDHFKLALAENPAMDEAREWVESLSNVPEQGGDAPMIAAAAPAEQPNADSSATVGEEPRRRESIAARDVAPRGVPLPVATGNNLQPLPPVDDPPSPTLRY